MSTRSYIGKQNKDGSIKYVYCHFDGYINGGVGETLFLFYKDEKKIDQLLELGDLSCLGKTTNSEDTCAYSRDNGEDLIIREAASIEDFGRQTTDNVFIDYVYLYKDGEWVVWDWEEKKYITENIIISTLEMELAS